MIKIIETKDYNLLAELNEEIQTFHHIKHPDIFKPYDKEAISGFFQTVLNNDNTVAYIAKDDETTTGYVLLFKINFADNPFQYSRSYLLLDQILVLKNFQGKGVGKRLLDTTLSFAKENNMDYVELNHWTQNDSARKFFLRNNFEYYNEKMWRAIK